MNSNLYKIENPMELTFEELMNKKEEIIQWLGKHWITNYHVNDDLTVDVDGSVYLDKSNLTHIPIQFGVVVNNFDISCNKITSLKGCPHTVGKSFNCSSNLLENLEYGPKSIGEDYNCTENKIISLSGSPEVIPGVFKCGFNKLTDLSNGPSKVSFYRCEGNNILFLKDFKCDVTEEFYHKNEFANTGSNKIKGYEDYYNDSDQLIIKGRDLSAIESYKKLSKTVIDKGNDITKKKKI